MVGAIHELPLRLVSSQVETTCDTKEKEDMSLLGWVITFIIGVIAALIAHWLITREMKPEFVGSVIERVCSKLVKFIKIPYVHFIIIILFLIFLAKITEIALSSYKAQKLLVALSNFHLVSGAEITDNNALISHLQDSLTVYKNDIELLKKVCPVVRDTSEAKKLGEKEGANIVIWGSIEKTSIEAEIIPRITIVRPLGKMKLEARQPEPAIKISIAELDQIEFKKREAREITDVILFIWGFAKYKTKKYQETLSVFENIQNKNAETFFYIGNCYLFLLDFTKAKEKYQIAIQMDSNFTQAYNNWALTLINLTKKDETVEIFMEAVRLNPNYAKGYYNLRIALEDLGRYEEAVRLNTNLVDVYYSWGLTLVNSGKFEEAIEKFNEVVKIDSNLAETYYLRGAALWDLGKYEEAIEKFERVIAINPNYAKAHKTLGNILLFYLGRKEEAKKKYLTALELFRKQGRDEDAKEVEGFLKMLEGK